MRESKTVLQQKIEDGVLAPLNKRSLSSLFSLLETAVNERDLNLINEAIFYHEDRVVYKSLEDLEGSNAYN